MTLKQAEAELIRQYPHMDQVMRARILNIFQQIKDAASRPCQMCPMGPVVAPAKVRLTLYGDHTEDIPL